MAYAMALKPTAQRERESKCVTKRVKTTAVRLSPSDSKQGEAIDINAGTVDLLKGRFFTECFRCPEGSRTALSSVTEQRL